MKITLPVLRKEIKGDKLDKREEEKEFDLDMTLVAQIRFETKFPELAKVEDLYNYSKRICEIKTSSVATLISKIKMLYCWLDTDMEFVEFLRLFDLTDEKYINKLIKSIQFAFDIIVDGAAEKN